MNEHENFYFEVVGPDGKSAPRQRQTYQHQQLLPAINDLHNGRVAFGIADVCALLRQSRHCTSDLNWPWGTS